MHIFPPKSSGDRYASHQPGMLTSGRYGSNAMRKILVIGIGAGNPDYVTIQAINALNQVDVFFIPNKGMEKEALQRSGWRYARDTSRTGLIASPVSRRRSAPRTLPTIN